MSSLHPTISDKDRSVGMNEDGEWHGAKVLTEWDGVPVLDFVPPLRPEDDPTKMRTYWVDTRVGGKLLALPDTDRPVIEFRYDRVPVDDEDNGTALSNAIDLRLFRVGGLWHANWAGKVEFYPEGYVSPKTGLPYSWKARLSYNVNGGRLTLDNRVVKLLRQRDI